MNILMLNHNVVWRGGTFFRAYHFGRHLAVRGHQVTLLTIAPSSRYRFHEKIVEGVHIVETPDLLWGVLRSGWDVWDALTRIIYTAGQQYDLVHGFDSRPVVILPSLYHGRIRNSRLVLDWADWWGRGGTIYERPNRFLWRALAPIETFFEEAFRKYADGTTVISQALYRRALSLKIKESTMIRIPQGSDVERIKPITRSEARQVLGLSLDTPLLGHLGVLQPKDAELLLCSFQIIHECHNHSRLIMIGNRGVDVRRYGMNQDAVIETGFVDYENMVRYLAACDILLLPLRNTVSNQARWPSRINDYLAVGRPVVTCPVGDISALFREYNIGLLAGDNPHDFAGVTLSLLEDRPSREEMGFNARRVAEEQLSWSKLTDQLEVFYYKILSQSGPVERGGATEKLQREQDYVA